MNRRRNALSSLPALVAILVFWGLQGTLRGAEPEFKESTPELVRVRDGIPHFLSKIKNKEDVKVAYFGGSITAADGWRVQTLAAFNEKWSDSKFSEINAAIGGTGSDLGVYRLDHDVLQGEPDLVFVEFCVNDGGTPPELIWRQMEGIVRQIWRRNLETDIAFVYTFRVGHEKDYLAGKTPRSVSAMEQIAEFYGIPTLDFNIPVVEQAESGKLTYQSDAPEEGKLHFSTDGVHPLKEGHQIYTKVVMDALVSMLEQNENAAFPGVETRSEKLEKVFVADNYENAKFVPIKESQLSGDWSRLPDDSPLAWIKGRMGKDVFTSNAPGSTLSFTFRGSRAMIYNVLGPNGGQVRIAVDGTERGPVPQFDSYCTYHRLASLFIAGDLDPNAAHEVVVEIDAEQPDRTPVAFRLQDPEKELAEPKYQGHNVWFGPIMVLGDVVD